MTNINMVKNTTEKDFFGFHLKSGHLFGWVKYDWNIDIPVILTDPSAGFLYAGFYPEHNEGGRRKWNLHWEKFLTTAKASVVAVGEPQMDLILKTIGEEELSYEKFQERLIDPETSAAFPFIGTAIEGTKEEDLSFFLADADDISEERWGFDGFTIKPCHCVGFLRNLHNGKKIPAVFIRLEHEGLEKAFVKNPTSGKWDEVWLNLKKSPRITHRGYPLETFLWQL